MISVDKHLLVVCILLFSCCFQAVASPSSIAKSHPHSHALNASQPIPPRQDPWYSGPAGFETQSPGSVLRIREAPGNLTTVIGNCSAAYNILFRTTNSLQQPAFAVTTLFAPLSTNATVTSSLLLSYQIPYNTADVNQSPSYLLYSSDYPDIPTALGQGWIVNVPDFEGPQASFLLGLSEGQAVLDSIRSVLSQDVFPMPPNSTRTVLWGYSGGSIASTFALERHAQYAPELRLHGAALGGLVPNFAASTALLNASPQAGLLTAAFLGLTSQSPTARALLASSLIPANASAFFAAENYTHAELFEAFVNQDIFTTYFTNYTAFFYAPEIQALQRDNWHLGFHGVPQVPMFIYKAIEDEVAPVEEVDDLVGRWCALGGVEVRYERNRVGNHETEYVNGADRARLFLERVFEGMDGSVWERVCSLQDVTVGVVKSGEA